MTQQYSLTGLTTQQPVIDPQPVKPRHSSSSSQTPSESVPTVLRTARRKYQYNYSYIAPVAMVDRLPKEELPSMAWWSKLIRTMFTILVNAIVGAHNHHEQEAEHHISRLIGRALFDVFKERPEVRWRLIWHLLKTAPKTFFNGLRLSFSDSESFIQSLTSNLEHDLLRVLHLNLKSHLSNECGSDRPTSIEDFNQQFTKIPLPECAQYFQEDEFFAYLRVAGPNPVMLQQVRHLSGDFVLSHFPVTNDHYQAVMGDHDSLEAAVAEGRVYIADYAVLAGAINGTYPDEQKYISAPIALFAVPASNAPSPNLQPVAIQCSQSPGPESPILTPPTTQEKTEQQYAWNMAKTCVQVADSNYHEAVTHLARTHLFISPFVIATHRQLLPSHPVSILLRPHFEGTLSINNGAQSMLMAPEGGVDSVLAATIDCARVLSVTGLQSYSFNQAMLPTQLQQHGLDNPDVLPVNPYRDDALLVWQAIETWVTDYLSLYYSTDASVQNDTALQAWAQELQAPDGGRVHDFGEDGQLRTQAYLIQAITLIIFTASAQHAAVNFPQGDIMVYSPGMPLAAYQPEPQSTSMSQADYLGQLPPLHQALGQLELTYLLGQVYHTQLGQYEKAWFIDERVKAPLHRFQANLLDIEAMIEERNQHRPYPYRYLQPSKIPQSINI